MEEIDLINGLQNRNQSSIMYFVQGYQQFVFAVIYRMIEQRESSEEITQDVLVKCIERIDQFSAQSSLKTWVYRIARNETINYIRKNERQIETVHEDQVPIISMYAGDEKDDLEFRDMQNLIKKYLNKLPADQKEMLILFYLKELSIKEISQALDLKENNAKVKLFRARDHFAKLLSSSDVELLNEMRYG